MKETSWGKEPFDLRLTILRMIRLFPLMAGITALGILLLWGGYYLKNVVLNAEKTYGASATFFIDYADEEWYVNAKYFNDYTWNIWLKSDQFLDAVERYLSESDYAGEDPKNLFTAEVPADLRVVIIRSIASDPKTATARIEALQKVLQQDFPAFVEEIGEVRVVDFQEATLNLKDLRMFRAFVLAAVISLLFAITLLLMRELTQEKIWLPTTLTDRFGLKSLGVPGEKAYAEWNGDAEDLDLCGEFSLPGNKAAIDEAGSYGKPIVTCIIAGRNIFIADYIDRWDGVVMCYLPGSEAQGIADVLCGGSDFKGRVPSPWYASVSQIGSEDAWLEKGFGLTYQDRDEDY